MGSSNSPTYFIGTSGWTYDHWRGGFYPQGMAKSRWFDYYAARFNAVEVNATFYRAFKDETYLKWKDRAPEGFGYVLKAPKIISHQKKLKDAEEDIQHFYESAVLLGDKFQMILLQAAPDLPYDLERIRRTLLAFPDPGRVALEFRHKRWFNREVTDLIASMGAVFCNVDSPDQDLTEFLTAERAYLRLHGHDQWYAGNYSEKELENIAGTAERLANRGAKQIFIFFNNDFEGHAPTNAQDIMKLLMQQA